MKVLFIKLINKDLKKLNINLIKYFKYIKNIKINIKGLNIKNIWNNIKIKILNFYKKKYKYRKKTVFRVKLFNNKVMKKKIRKNKNYS